LLSPSVKSLSVSDDEVEVHLRAIRHQKAIQGHVKALLGADDLDDDGTRFSFGPNLKWLHRNASEVAIVADHWLI
jgi:hypothetical protein